MRIATGLANRKTISFEAAVAQHLNLKGTSFGNLAIPLGNGLGRAAQTASKCRDPAKVLKDFFHAMHGMQGKHTYDFWQVRLLTSIRAYR